MCSFQVVNDVKIWQKDCTSHFKDEQLSLYADVSSSLLHNTLICGCMKIAS